MAAVRLIRVTPYIPLQSNPLLSVLHILRPMRLLLSVCPRCSCLLMQASPESLRTFLEPMDIPEAGRRLHVTVQVSGGGGGRGGV
jgi:hypothetical protein